MYKKDLIKAIKFSTAFGVIMFVLMWLAGK